MPDSDNGTQPLTDSELEKLSFEEALKLFEDTVAELEAGGLSLADATDRYERGVRLAARCNDMLGSAELKITRIKAEFGQQMTFQSEPEIDPPDDWDDEE
ncbi:MAG: exodeoxyribonuclease VII small subunit [SAR202 cluster bacterium]|jgi:exodeoxyribonuclease VII small subunit|nr:exodeoxyribonuclease VII small subunit [SAR202 cluster bacterium]MDP6514694.1 exodeoxyribonuclease VII small subunit [SAR202 cluster bacterium]MDP6715872.1 exodeoxyribonuclease VII small subunit [SAR202 cluster bacterium]